MREPPPLPPYRRNGEAEEPDGESFWMSYGDLFAGLLMIFALMLLTALYSYQSGLEGVREILAIRQEVVESLERELRTDDGRVVEITPAGTVRFGDQVLFEQNSFDILPEGREQLAAFARRYMGIILDEPRFREQISRIVVEGHTNDDGEYFYNLRLSQERAFAVMALIINAAEERHRELLIDRMTAVGRSFADLRYLDSQESVVDREGSRRIEIRFELDDDRVMQELLERFTADNRTAPAP